MARLNFFYIAITLAVLSYSIDLSIQIRQHRLYYIKEIPKQLAPYYTDHTFQAIQNNQRKISFAAIAKKTIFFASSITLICTLKRVVTFSRKISNSLFKRWKFMVRHELSAGIIFVTGIFSVCHIANFFFDFLKNLEHFDFVVLAALLFPAWLIGVIERIFLIAAFWYIFVKKRFVTTVGFWGFGVAVTTLLQVSLIALTKKYTTSLTFVAEGLKESTKDILEEIGFKYDNIRRFTAVPYLNQDNVLYYGIFRYGVVLFGETFLLILTKEELHGVLAHEVGHWYYYHCTVRILIVSLVVLFLLVLMEKFVNSKKDIYSDFGFEEGSILVRFAIFFCLFDSVFIYLKLIVYSIFQAQEFQADRFAKSIGLGEELARALFVMKSGTYTEILIERSYSLLHYTHPPILERIKYLVN